MWEMALNGLVERETLVEASGDMSLLSTSMKEPVLHVHSFT